MSKIFVAEVTFSYVDTENFERLEEVVARAFHSYEKAQEWGEDIAPRRKEAHQKALDFDWVGVPNNPAVFTWEYTTYREVELED